MLDRDTYVQTIRDLFPSVYVYRDHPFTELIVTPVDMLRGSLSNDIDYVKGVLSLDVNMPENELDKIAANYQIVRAAGSKARGAITLALNIPMAFSPVGLIATTGGGLKFIVTRTLPVRADEFVRFGTYYAIRLDVIAENQGSDYNVGIRVINAIGGFPYPVLFAVNESKMVGGADRQSNSQVVTAIQMAITDRSLTRKTGLAVRLISDFPDFIWIKAVGTGDPEMKRDMFLVDGNYIRLGNMADVYVYPESGYSDNNPQVLNLGVNSQQIMQSPALGPFSVIDANSNSVPSAYWEIRVKDVNYDNSVQEEKVVNFKSPINVFSTSSPVMSDFISYGVIKNDEALIYTTDDVGSRCNVVGVNPISIFLSEPFPVGSATGRVYLLLREADSPYVKYDATTNTFRLYDTGMSDFTTLTTDPFWATAPHLHLYQVALIGSTGVASFLDVVKVTPSYIELSGSYEESPVSYRIVQSRLMERKVSLKFETWIEPYHYFKASLVLETGGAARMVEDLIMPLITQMSGTNLYVNIGSEYYLITNIGLEGQTLFVQIKYDSSITNIATLINQGVYSLSNAGQFGSRSTISDVAVEPVQLIYRTYSILAVQEALKNNDYRLITTDYLARVPYEAEVLVNVSFKGSVTAGVLASKIIEFINAINPLTSSASVGFLQASDIIAVCYQNGADYIDLSTFSVKVVLHIPTSSTPWTLIEDVEYELYGEDIKRNMVFKYFCTSDDITIREIF